MRTSTIATPKPCISWFTSSRIFPAIAERSAESTSSSLRLPSTRRSDEEATEFSRARIPAKLGPTAW